MRTTLISLLTLLLFSVALADTPEVLLTRANRLRNSGIMMEAATVYEQYLLQVPKDIDTRLQLIQILQELKQKDRANTHVKYLVQQFPKDPRIASMVTSETGVQRTKKVNRIEDFEARIRQPNVPAATVLDFARYLSGNGMSTRASQVYEQYLQMKPEDNSVRLEYAKVLGWSRNYKASADELNTIIAKNPTNIEARMFLADITFWQGEEDAAVELYRKVLAIEPKNTKASSKIANILNQPGYKEKQILTAVRKDPQGPALSQLAQYYLKVNRIYEADSLVSLRLRVAPKDTAAKRIKEEISAFKQKLFTEQTGDYRKRIASNPTDSSAIRKLAQVYSTIPDHKGALELYDTYLKLVPQDNYMRLDRARVMYWMGRSNETIEELRMVNTALPGNREANLALANALMYSNSNLPEAETLFRLDSLTHPSDLSTLYGLAEAKRRQGNYGEAKSLYSHILAIDTTNSAAKQGMTMLDKDLSPLIMHLEKQVLADPGSYSMRRRLAGLYVDAKRYYEARQHIKILLEQNPEDNYLKSLAEDIDRKLLENNNIMLFQSKQRIAEFPDSLELRIAYAQALSANGKHNEAVAQYRYASERRQSDDELRFQFALELTADKQFDEAQRIYQQLADGAPRNFDYRFRFAQALSWAGDNDHAVLEYERALRLKPESTEAQLGIANAYLWKGDSYSAYEAYNRVLGLDPKSTEAKRALRDLNGPFLRGVKIDNQYLTDNSDYTMREETGSLLMNFTLPLRLRLGGGDIELSQNGYGEIGWFGLAGIEYTFDKHTYGSLVAKGYQFAKRRTQAIRADLNYEITDDITELSGMKTRLTYANSEAIFDIAATKELQTFLRRLRSERVELWLSHSLQPRWSIEGQLDFLSFSNNKNRTEFWGEIGYDMSKYFTCGGRYEVVTAQKVDSSYWSPDQYTTIGAWVKFKRTNQKFSYYLKGGLGQVQKTNDQIRNLAGSFDWHFSRRVSLGLSYAYLRTVRTDGEYWYQGVFGAVTINL